MTNYLYTDGGVINRNPSEIGGTYAWIFTQHIEGFDEMAIAYGGGVLLPQHINSKVITNNQTELYAVLDALNYVSDYWFGTICSDSQTTLGRLFNKWKLRNIPDSMIDSYIKIRERLVNWNKMGYILLEGHPTKIDLARGYGKSSRPVSRYNLECDKMCGEKAKEYLLSYS